MIRWRLRTCPPPKGRNGHPPPWLGPAERERLDRLAFVKRRNDWLLGRFTAKQLVRDVLLATTGERIALEGFDVVPEGSGAPVVRRADGTSLPVGVTISHSQGVALAVAFPSEAGFSVGADLERIEPRSEQFVLNFFNETEIDAWLRCPEGHGRDFLANAIWAAKEAVLKLLHVGLTVDTRKVECALTEERAGGGWRRFTARCAPDLPGGNELIEGRWRLTRGFALTVAARREPARGALRSDAA